VETPEIKNYNLETEHIKEGQERKMTLNSDNKRYSLWIGRVLYFKGKLAGPESAVTFFQKARISDRILEELVRNPEMYMTQEKLHVYTVAKRYAQYWIGLTCLENDRTVSAMDHFLDAEKDPITLSGQLWSQAITYNLGRTFERLGQYAEAIKRYEKNPNAMTGPGNAIRVKWLQELM
jgi:tetratricopeptide (TPR) repeat protein